MLGEFYGITSASAALLDIPSTRLNILVAQLNTGLDSEKISKFKIESDYLVKLLTSKVIEEYQSPSLAKKSRAVELIKLGAADRLKKTYGIDLPSEGEREGLINSILGEIEDEAKKDNIRKSIINRFETVAGDIISLQEIDLQILKSLKRLGVRVLNRYSKISTSMSWDEVMVFNFRLSEVATRSPTFLLKIVTDFFDNPNLSVSTLITLCTQWVATIRENMQDEPEADPEDINNLLESLNRVYRFDLHIAAVRGLDLTTTALAENDKKMVDTFYAEDQVKKILERLIRSQSISYSTVEAVVATYFDTYRLDNDLAFVNNLLGTASDSFDEIDASYERLKSIGLFTLHRKNHLLFVESLKKISFSKHKISFIQSGESLAFEKLLRDIENFCRSLYTPGTLLEDIK